MDMKMKQPLQLTFTTKTRIYDSWPKLMLG